MAPLREIVKQKQLWACHLEPELGGQGYGQVNLGLMNEVLGRSRFGPSVFGCQAPDSGNAEILAKFGTPEQKETYLKPLLNAEIASCYSMTEPQAGADPGEFLCTATRDGDHWVINGEKWFASHARFSAFLLVMVVTNPDAPIHEGASIFLVEQGTPGMEIIRNSAVGPYIEQGDGVHAYISFKDCRVPAENLLGNEGQGFHVAQTRLGGGRVHHAMRTVGVIRRAIDMMCERALSRRTKGELLADKQMTQEKIADAYTMMMQYRLHVLYTAWLIDKHKEYNREVRKEIAAHGVSVVHIKRDNNGKWDIVFGSPFNRRVTGNTEMDIRGPVRGYDKLVTKYSPDATETRGTLNNCAMGPTPWGTYLAAEENWHGYFANSDATQPREQTRHGVGGG